MCDPLSMAAIAVVGTGAQVIAQNQAASAANKALDAQNKVRKEEIDKAATAEINDRLREARREQGRILVAASQAGLSLSSGGIESLLLDSTMQAKLANDRSLANRESRKKASDAETQANYRSSSTLLGAGLQIASAGASAFAGAKAAQNKG